ncbi:MAG: winged helix-turn-helix domain-containing protein [Bacteriovoracales bacterium]|nr:winged helix-turn-helix domain-containing protein [Bacteriovoracales bacterium]
MRKENIIWILEDEPGCQIVYRETLDCIYRTFYFSRLEEFNNALKRINDGVEDEKNISPPELIIADLKLEDGFFTDYLEEKGESSLPAPFIVISTYDNLDLFRWCSKRGCLDFMVKPFKKNELIFKLEKIFDNSSADRVLHFIKHNHIQLTSRENQILKLFLSRDKAVSHEEIVREVWKGACIHENNVNVQISRLRDKLEASPYRILHVGDKTWILDRGQIV